MTLVGGQVHSLWTSMTRRGVTRVVEPLFLGLSARISTRPAFGLEDMANLGETLGPIVQKYA
ncbi:MAG: hypothetical protein IIC28_13205 [Chloroflexi bacterium]|nr:hypothetical protein [Chloroflexota bacterium]